ncbi:MAG: hypothetical protein ACFB22_03900 [Rhodothalassiaceae bacterium]
MKTMVKTLILIAGLGGCSAVAEDDSQPLVELSTQQEGEQVYFGAMQVGEVRRYLPGQNKLEIAFIDGEVRTVGPDHLRRDAEGRLVVIREEQEAAEKEKIFQTPAYPPPGR